MGTGSDSSGTDDLSGTNFKSVPGSGVKSDPGSTANSDSAAAAKQHQVFLFKLLPGLLEIHQRLAPGLVGKDQRLVQDAGL